MPSFSDIQKRAVSMKNSTTERVGNYRDRHTSASTAKLDLETRVEAQRHAPPPIPDKPKPKKAPPPPPTHRARASQDIAPVPSPAPTLPARGGGGALSPPMPPRGGGAPPALPSRGGSASPALPSRGGSASPALPPRDGGVSPAPPTRHGGGGPPPIRKANRPGLPELIRTPEPVAQAYSEDSEDLYAPAGRKADKIDWVNLSSADKQVFFSWLDEFFTAYLARTRGAAALPPAPVAPPAPSPAAPTRPALPARNTTTDAAPTTKARFLAPAPVVKAYDPPPLLTHADSAPPPVIPGNRPPPIVRSTRPPTPTLSTPDAGSCIRCHDFTLPDAHGAQFPRSSVRSLPELADDLTAPFDSAIDKARAICVWLHHNITYDSQAFLSGNLKASTPDGTLKSGMAVCEGYAGLFAALALRAGLEVVVISGHGKGFGYAELSASSSVPSYTSNHAWNAVRLDDGAWKLLDSCWAGGALGPDGVFNRRWDPSHFEETNEDFGKRHFPEPREPWKQFVERPRAWEEYMRLEPGPQLPLDFYTRGYAAHLVQPRTLKIPPGRTEFRLKHRCEHTREDERELYLPIIMSANAQWEPMHLDPVRGGYVLEVDVVPGETVTLGVVDTVNGRDAKGLTYADYKARAARQSRTFAGLTLWNVSAS